MFLVRKELEKNKKRFTLIILIIFLISYLVFFLTGLSYGLADANRSSIDLWNAESIILSKGSNNSLIGSMIDYKEYEKLDPNIKKNLSPVNISRSTYYRNSLKDEKNILNITMLGVDYKSQINPVILEGDIPKKLNEVVASIDLKEESGLQLGDTLLDSQTERELKVVGFTESAKYSVSPVIYGDLFLPQPGLRLVKPTDATSGATSLNYEQIPNMPYRISGIVVHEDVKIKNKDLEKVEIDEFINKLPGYKAQVLTFLLMIGFLVVISAIVLGVFIYIINLQKKNIFAIMKVQGISSSYIGRSVFIQTLTLSLIGILLGFIFAQISGIMLPATVPFKLNYVFFVLDALLMLITSILGSLFAIRSVMHIDPLEALK